MSVRRSTGGAAREALPVRELLTRATWDDLSRIAAHHSIQFAGRRRALAVERLATILERPDQLRAAYRILPDAARAVLGLLLLLGSVDDERGLQLARERLLALRPDLDPTLGRAHLANEIQTLTALGLCFRDRRRLIVPLEVLDTLPLPLPLAPPELRRAGEPGARAALLADAPLDYAALRYAIEQLVAAVAQTPLAALPPHVATDREAAYHTLLISPDAASALGLQLTLPPADVVLLLALLEVVGVVAPARGQWQVQPAWHAFQQAPPRACLDALLAAWQRPRALSDLARTGSYGWMCAPDAEATALVGQYEATIRTLLWRWLLWSDGEPIDTTLLCRMFGALHGERLAPDDDIWVSYLPGGRSASAGGPRYTQVSDPEEIALALVPQLLRQLTRLGLVGGAGETCTLSPTAAWLLAEPSETAGGATIQSAGATQLLVQPLAVAPALLRLLTIAGRMLPPAGALARYELEAQGVARLLAHGVAIAELEQALTAAGAALGPELREQLESWAARAGRLRLHRPLSVLVLADETPAAQVLAATGLGTASEIVGPGCALIPAEGVDATLEQLRGRGYWPLEI